MVVGYIISSTIRAATDAHTDWKYGMQPRYDHSLIYKPVYKLTTVIERKVNPNPNPNANLNPNPHQRRVAHLRSSPQPIVLAHPTERRRRSPRRAPTEIDCEFQDEDDPPPPYPGTSTVMPPRYQA
ncbi:hypothetical protein CcaverHIS002_0305640 [Cutaneotrichosporon cavernicola]|uniref:Uncharacterized protein n=1 Tax=Cutaneotrichosporon cavernicola TaxID=279322 RepID=A0AA48I9U4_9TREE|nr:uncharacterized protein CcaverHIS019_0305600 [Cutaneotrichosporon cavernicola]BEI82696.1 hypothetical protein CcaverHIS002_0305640 [Cutaneotrichosporon cavernicola]BEI90490.1 hypothetical protein CcaverHIS019_0305600 [Cutaneotrichosporon cavernicola]BEI98264.1 hypothetical protein CcaverHIS631_0305630 [Cutaneotrichosporon cavernicola]BEJ06039.1 hypothetical protein CcaverHIS641_0305610 [Cutaneotrichosporon cavernicola]